MPDDEQYDEPPEPRPFTGPSEPDVPEADAIEQREPLVGPAPEHIGNRVTEASEHDIVEQNTPVEWQPDEWRESDD